MEAKRAVWARTCISVFFMPFMLLLFGQMVFGEAVYVTDHGSSVFAFDIVNNEFVYRKTLTLPNGSGVDLAIDDENGILFRTIEFTPWGIDIIDAQMLTRIKTISLSVQPDSGIVYDEARQRLICVKRNSDTLYTFAWNPSTQNLTLDETIELNAITYASDVSIDGDILYVSEYQYGGDPTYEEIYRYDMADDFAYLGKVDMQKPVISIDYNAADNSVYGGAWQGDDNRCINKRSFDPNSVVTKDIGANVIGLSVNSRIAGRVFVTTYRNGGTIEMWDMSDSDPNECELIAVYDNNNSDGVTLSGLAGLVVGRNFIEPVIPLVKTDDVEDCINPDGTITYTICWENVSEWTAYDAWIEDFLPSGVTYPQGGYSIVFGDPNDPNEPFFWMQSPDPAYNPASRSYVWELGNIEPGDANCVTLEVTVNNTAEPGRYLQNTAELWGTVYDANGLNPVTTLLGRVIKNTLVCCYDTSGILYVDKSAIGGGKTGTSWQNAYTDLQDALTRAREAICAESFTIYVAQGTYCPGENESNTFEIPDEVILYGGFKPGGCEFEERNPERYKTVLSGKIDQTRRNNTVVKMGDNTLLDGFTITESSQDGQGLYVYEADCSITNGCLENNLGYGAYIEDGNATFTWCRVRNNEADGIYHSGSGYTLTVENCWIQRSRQYGVRCLASTPVIRSSNITESDLAQEGRAGIQMFYPTGTPYLQNVTCAHNKAEGVVLVGSTLPVLQNCIVYHNGGAPLAGFTADQAAWYSIIQDCNEVNYNINDDPEFAYFDPNNVRISYNSPARNSGNPYLDYENQMDMDGRQRILETAVDRGAYEIDCEDVSNPLDWNADGIVNFGEFNLFSKAWLSHDPNDPEWRADPNLQDPNLAEGWYEWKYRCNLNTDGDSAYSIDLADLMVLVEEAPWLWCACWLDLEEMQMLVPSGAEGMAGGDEEFVQAWSISDMMMSDAIAVQEKSIQEQIVELQDALVFLARLWLDEPEIRQEIDTEVWQEFMLSVYQELVELQTQGIQLQ